MGEGVSEVTGQSMDDPQAVQHEAHQAGAPSRGTPRGGGRSPRQDRTRRPTPSEVVRAVGRPAAMAETPLVASRSLGPLLGMSWLHFKLENCQLTGSWLDRGAAGIVASETGLNSSAMLGVVGAGPVSRALAVQCARVGRQLMVLLSAAEAREAAWEVPWLGALGARIVVVDADAETLRSCAPAMLEQVRGRYVGQDDPLMQAGLRALQAELTNAGLSESLLALGLLTGHEAGWLAAATREGQAAIPFPLDGMDPAEEPGVHAVVGSLTGEATTASRIDGGVIRQPVSAREATAAHRLLAREEGIVASVSGAVGLAALIRAIQDDRRQPIRERRLPRDVSAVVVVTGDPPQLAGSTLAGDAWPGKPVSLAEAQADLVQLLANPGRLAGG